MIQIQIISPFKGVRGMSNQVPTLFSILLLTGFITLLSPPTLGQQTLSTKSKKAIELYTEADNFRVRGQATEAVNLLEQALSKDKNFVEAYYRLGLVYLGVKRYPQAIANFERGLSLTEDIRKQKVFWFDLAEAYFYSGDFDKSIATYNSFLKAEVQNKPKIDKANMMLRNAEFVQANQAIKSAYNQHVLSDTVNQFATQYFPVLTADQNELIFTRRLGYKDENDEDLVISTKDSGHWGVPVSLSSHINSMANEGTCTISADGRKLIFTSCSGRKVYGSCDLFESTKIGDDWTDPVNLGPNVNSSEWESQPSLSADGRTLYFVSDRRGGYGRNDIWYSTADENGQWSKAKNLGTPINTQYNEMSPFIHVNNRTLYFASNGLVGFGGHDIYYSERDGDNWSKPTNIGSPINNQEDQFSLFITADGKKGYYSHEERAPSGYSVGKIYEFQIPESQQIKFKSNYVKGIITDKKTKKPLKAKIELFDIINNEIVSLVSSDSISGKYLMVLTQGSEYALYVNKKGYLFNSQNFNYSTITNFEPLEINIELEPVIKGSVSVLKNIFFDVDKYDLKEKSITELEKVIRFLQENPKVKVEISGHTDNTGSLSYNQQLSEKRAQSVYTYITEKGIDSKRVSWKGVGSTRPIATNETEEGRQLNRRIEFTIQ